MSAFTALFILEVMIVFSFAVTTLFMFVPRNNETVHKIFFAMSVMLGILVTVIDATALPANYISHIITAWLGLVPSAVGIIIAVAKGKPNTAAKLLTMLTTILGVLGYFFLA